METSMFRFRWSGRDLQQRLHPLETSTEWKIESKFGVVKLKLVSILWRHQLNGNSGEIDPEFLEEVKEEDPD